MPGLARIHGQGGRTFGNVMRAFGSVALWRAATIEE
jgi:hypothetical protein